MLQSLTDILRRINSGDRTVKPEGSQNTARRRKISPSELYHFEDSIGDASSSSHKNQTKRRYQNRSRDEFKKAIPPTF